MSREEDCWCHDIMEFCLAMREQLSKIEDILRHHTHEALTLDIVEWQDLRINIRVNEVFFKNAKLPLTHSEWKLLALLAANRNEWVSHQRMAERLWGMDIDGRGSPQALKVYVRHLREKLPSGVIETLHGHGYRCYLPESKERELV